MINTNNYINWDDLISHVNANSEIKIQKSGNHPQHKGLCMVGKPVPVSINNDEFNFLKNFIIKHNLKYGFELATGFGISALAIALGFLKTGGLLWSVDSYEEEMIQRVIVNNCEKSHKDSDGQFLANGMSFLFGANEHAEFVIAKFPQECSSLINGNIIYDFVFFDGPKDDASFIEAFDIIRPCLSEKFAIFIHDTHTYLGTARKHVNNVLGLDFVNAIPSQTLFPLMMISNL